MSVVAAGSVFSIPFRYLWSTNFAGDLEGINERPNGLARFVGDGENRLLKILSDEFGSSFVRLEPSSLWPLVLFGPSGTGKTSLALSIVSELADRSTRSRSEGSPAAKPIALSAADFDRRFRSALATDSIVDFRRRLVRCSGLVIDDVHYLADKLAAQTELLQITDQLISRHRPFVVTMDRDPQLINGLMPQLVSRFSAGMCLPVQQPGRLAREVIIRDMCQIHGLELTTEAVQLLVDRLNVTAPKIAHFMGQLKTASRVKLKPRLGAGVLEREMRLIDVDFISLMFDRSDEDVLRLAKIISQHVATEYKLKPKDLRGNSRKQSIVLARAVAIYLTRKLLGCSFLKIGTLFGHRDHSTIIHAYRKIESLLYVAAHDSTDNSPAMATDQRTKKLMLQLTNLFVIP